MKKIIVLLLFSGLAVLSLKAQLLFSDNFNYPNSCVETDGLWFATAPVVPHQDALILNDRLILNQNNFDAVAAPFTNNSAPSLVYASFNINVSQLPTANGGYFCVLSDGTNNVAHIFIDANGTSVPGTYRLGVANYNTSLTYAGSTNFPLDLATGITYKVVFNWDEVNGYGANLWVNPSAESDSYVFGRDTTNNTYLQMMPVSQIGLSQYANQGTAAIGNVMVGNTFNDVMTNVVQLPVIGVQPQPSTLYAGNNLTLYTAASGMDVTYQWYANDAPLADNGTTIVGSVNNVLNLTNLQASANYSVVATDAAGSVTSSVVLISIITTPTPPFFTLQPQSSTNSALSPVTLTAAANGTGPITYQWYFEAAGGGSFSALSGQTSSTLSFSAAYVNSGLYYVTATGGNSVGSQNSAIANVVVIPPPLFSIGYMHNYITNLNGNSGNLNGGQIFNVQGVVTSIGQLESKTASEFFIQDGTGGCLVYAGGFSPTNTPPVGALVNVVSPAESYYGELEMDPTTGAATNAVIILSTNNPLPATIVANLGQWATNNCSVQGNYGWSNQCSVVTMTNVYLYLSATGTLVSGNFPTNSTKALYAFQNPYVSGLSIVQQPYVEVYVYTYTNVLNQLSSNYWGKPIPSFCREISGAMSIYNPTTPELVPSRYADFVTATQAAFTASIKLTNGTPTLTWPAVTGSTYSVYSATSLLGPWTQTFGLSYYPSSGTYTDTNATAAKFYRVSTP
jgi:hypothetical protein